MCLRAVELGAQTPGSAKHGSSYDLGLTQRAAIDVAGEGELEEDGRLLQRGQELAMGKRAKKRDYSEKTRIDMNQSCEVAYWKQRFGVSDEDLEDAVRAVGTSVQKIEAYLKVSSLRAPPPGLADVDSHHTEATRAAA